MNPLKYIDNQASTYADENSESIVTACVLIRPELIDCVIDLLPDESAFTNRACSDFYVAAVGLYARRGIFDTAMLFTEMKRLGMETATEENLHAICAGPQHVSEELIVEHARRVIDCKRVRDAYFTMADAVWKLGNNPDDLQSIVDQAADQISEISAGTTQSKSIPLATLIREHQRSVLSDSKDEAYQTGFRTLDQWLRGGIRPGEVMVIGGRPGQGKSALGMNIMLKTSARGNPCAFFTIEMSAQQLASRAAAVCGCPMNADSRDAEKLEHAATELEKLPAQIIDMPTGKAGEIRSYVRSLSRRGGYKVFVVDYLQLVRIGKDGIEEYQRVTMASQAMKQIAREYGVAMIVLAQINRDGGKKERPTMSDLKGSGSIEQDADQIILIHNPQDDDDCEPELILAKHRNGRTGTVAVQYRAAQTLFIDNGEKTFTSAKDSWRTSIPI